MRIVLLMAVLFLVSASLLPVIGHNSNASANTSTLSASDYTSSSSSEKFYVRYTEYLNSSMVVKGNVISYNSETPGPAAVIYNDQTGTLFAASGENNIFKVNESTLSTQVASPSGDYPASLAFGSGHKILFILPGNNNLTEWNLTSGVSDNLTVGSYPQDMSYDPLNNNMYITVQGPKSLVDVNLTTNNVSYRIPLRFGPFGIVFDQHNGYLYISYPISGVVSVFDPADRSFVANITIGGSPYEFALSSDQNTIYATNQGLNQVDIINGTTQIFAGTISVGDSPSGITMSAGMHELFVANTDSSNVTVIDTLDDRPVQNIGTGSQPYSVAFDSSTDVVAVGNHGSNSLSFLYPVIYNYVVFTEKGLPAGTFWHVTVNGVTRVSNTDTISFDVRNSTMNYSAQSFTGYYGTLTGTRDLSGSTPLTITYKSVAALHKEILSIAVAVAVVGVVAGIWLFRGSRRRV